MCSSVRYFACMAVNTEANCNKSLLVMMPSGTEVSFQQARKCVWFRSCGWSGLRLEWPVEGLSSAANVRICGRR